MKLFRILAVPLLALSLVGSIGLFGAVAIGCAHNPAAPPPTAAQATAIGVDDFAASVQTAQNTEIEIFHQGYIDAPTHVIIQKGFQKAGQDIKAVAQAINTGQSAATISALITGLTADLNGDLKTGVLGVKDAKSQQQLQALISGLGTIAAGLAKTYGGQ